MLNYYLKLSLYNLKRAPVLYALVIITLAIGVGAFVANLAMINTMASDPIPEKSSQLFHVSMNTYPGNQTQQPLDVTRYADAKAIMDSGIASKTAITYRTSAYARVADSPSLTRYASEIRATTKDFFTMMNAPFLFGQGFSDDSAHEVVIGFKLNNTLFKGQNSVGKTIELGGGLYTVTGVLAKWELRPMFYHVAGDIEFEGTEDIFAPLETALDANWYAEIRSTSTDNWDNMEQTRTASAYYLQTWVQLDTPQQIQKMHEFLNKYSQKLKDQGQHPNPVNNHLDDVNQWLTINHVVDKRILAFAIATGLFLAVCIFNASSLLLARYSAANFETGLKRALGASKKQIMYQGLVEGLVAGALAGLLSLLLSWLFLSISILLLPDLDNIAVLDGKILLSGFAIALITTLLSALYPLFRAGRSSISTELKG
ncbi:ABC transporter permease [Paraglaciecola sp.]|uniref:ABC transporter permease n=1 Tax=Paraglaciecola sp. TaxID=1920173 RepID=UPI0030F3E453